MLAKRDDSACLQRLLKYPPVENVASILGMAWKYLGFIIKNHPYEFIYFIDKLKNIDEDELNQKNESKNKKEPIFFNSGLVYKPNTNKSQKNEKRFEEKSENYPAIMENQNKNFLNPEFERKMPLLSHQHERPKSTNTEQKKEVAAIIIENEEKTIISKPQQIFKEVEEKAPTISSESPRKIDFKSHPSNRENKEKDHVHRETKEKEHLIHVNTNNNLNVKLESLKERLNFINGQCQDIIFHLNNEQSK